MSKPRAGSVCGKERGYEMNRQISYHSEKFFFTETFLYIFILSPQPWVRIAITLTIAMWTDITSIYLQLSLSKLEITMNRHTSVTPDFYCDIYSKSPSCIQLSHVRRNHVLKRDLQNIRYNCAYVSVPSLGIMRSGFSHYMDHEKRLFALHESWEEAFRITWIIFQLQEEGYT